MNKKTKYIWLGVVGVILLVAIYFLNFYESSANGEIEMQEELVKQDTTRAKKPINPSGTYLLYNLLKKFENTSSLQTIQTSKDSSLKSILPKEFNQGIPNLYISIIEEYDVNSWDANHLLKFVEEGNYAFIATEDIDYALSSKLFSNGNVTASNFYDTIISINFLHPKYAQKTSLVLKNAQVNGHGFPKYTHWRSFNGDFLVGDVALVSSNVTGEINCVLVSHGDGFFIFSTTPSGYSNINLLNNHGKTNAEIIFSHFPKSNIYWHQNFGKYAESRGVAQPKTASSKSRPNQQSKSSPLQFILKQPALLGAFMLLLAGVLLYTLVYSKRRQKIIPPIEENENTSLEFIEVVSKLHFQQKQHNKLIAHKKRIFYTFLREHYLINANKHTVHLYQKISEKSGIEEKSINTIFKAFGKAEKYKFHEKELIDLYTKLDYFYKNCN